jgi:hypothetical protein
LPRAPSDCPISPENKAAQELKEAPVRVKRGRAAADRNRAARAAVRTRVQAYEPNRANVPAARPDMPANGIRSSIDEEVDRRASSEPRTPARPALGPWLLAMGIYAGLNFLTSCLRIELDEPLALRWLRALVEHPVRAVLAIAWIAIAFRRARMN